MRRKALCAHAPGLGNYPQSRVTQLSSCHGTCGKLLIFDWHIGEELPVRDGSPRSEGPVCSPKSQEEQGLFGSIIHSRKGSSASESSVSSSFEIVLWLFRCVEGKGYGHVSLEDRLFPSWGRGQCLWISSHLSGLWHHLWSPIQRLPFQSTALITRYICTFFFPKLLLSWGLAWNQPSSKFISSNLWL